MVAGTETSAGGTGTPVDAVLAELAADLGEEGSVISPHVADPPRGRGALGRLAAAGPDREPPYAAIVESIREGYLLHYGEPRLLDPPDDDLTLLAGDYMYAKGLERLAALGDLPSVRELSDLISLSAQLHAAEANAAAAAGALWLASAVAIATGPSDAHERAKRALIELGSAQPLYASAQRAAAGAGLDERFADATETVGLSPFDLG